MAALIMVACSAGRKKHYLMGTRVRYVQALLDGDLASGLHYLATSPDHETAYYFWCWIYGRIGAFLGVTLLAEEIYRQIWAIMMFIALSLTTFFVWRMYKNVILALLAAPMFFAVIKIASFDVRDDSTWFMAWAIYVVAPMLFLFWENNGGVKNEFFDKRKATLFAIIILCIGLSNVGRLHSGLGVTLALLFFLYKDKLRLIGNKLKKVAACLICLLTVYAGYFSFVQILPKAYFLYNGEKANVAYFGPWHTAYIGLGWHHSEDVKKQLISQKLVGIAQKLQLNVGKPDKSYENDKSPEYIIFLDECAALRASDIAQKSIYTKDKEYFPVLRAEYFRIMQEETSYFVKCYALKLLTILVQIAKYNFTLTALLGLAIGGLLILKKEFSFSPKRYYSTLVFLTAIDMVFPMMAIPFGGYMQGCYGGIATFQFFLCIDLARNVLAIVKEARNSKELLEVNKS